MDREVFLRPSDDLAQVPLEDEKSVPLDSLLISWCDRSVERLSAVPSASLQGTLDCLTLLHYTGVPTVKAAKRASCGALRGGLTTEFLTLLFHTISSNSVAWRTDSHGESAAERSRSAKTLPSAIEMKVKLLSQA